jgi:DNA polymerase elongation subunit (family B)
MVIDEELISFLDGSNEKKYVSCIETTKYNNVAHVIIHEPNRKYIEEMEYTPFIYMKDLTKLTSSFYRGDSGYKQKAMTKHGITITKLLATDKNNKQVERLFNGYKYLVKSSISYNSILNFFREGGINIYDEKNRNYFYSLKPNEQFCIQTGIRLFKGLDLYEDVHKFCFDIETSGLFPEIDRIFLIGMCDNKGYIEILGIDKENDDDSERKLILDFFDKLIKLEPSVIMGYNSENFDFNFIMVRAEILGLDLTKIKTSLNDKFPIKKVDASIKFGQETENYKKTEMWGFNIIDTNHAVRRAKAINSEIKETKLKYITKFLDAHKPNRMYIEDGSKIFKMWSENKLYIINPENNNYVLIPDNLINYYSLSKEEQRINNNFSEEEELFIDTHVDKINTITGKEIVEQYLYDDLWETMKVDSVYNEATFMVSKWLPTSFTRSSAIGGAGTWNMIMTAWSYTKNLAIPYQIKKRDFVGGLSRIFTIGRLTDVVKGDFAGLYPSIQLEYNLFPSHDVTDIIYRMLKYFKETRDVFKKKAGIEPDEKLKAFYNAKQLPLKIFNNSNFGAFGSEYFYWADIDLAERITCTGRQYLRKMVKFFVKHKFIPTVLDTDGVNVLIPETFTHDFDGNLLPSPLKIDEISFTNVKDEVLYGLDAFFEKLNQDVINGKYMKVDNDGMWVGGLNLARKNYVSYEIIEKKGVKKEKLKLVGNSIKSSSLPKYVEDFLQEGITYLIKDKPKEFIELYYKVFDRMYFNEIPAKEIASKARVKMNLKNYCYQIFTPSLVKLLLIETSKDEENESIDGTNKVPSTADFSLFIKEKYKPVNTKKTINKKPFKYLYDKIIYLLENNFLDDDTNIPTSIKNQLKLIVNYDADTFDVWYNEMVKNLIGIKITDEDCFEINDTNKKLYSDFIESIVKPYFMIHGDINGRVKAKQAHMELLIENNKICDLGDVIYYVNNGKTKSTSDSALDKEGKLISVLVDEDNLTKTVKYNVAKTVNNFNNRLNALMVCFKPIVHDKLLVTKPEDKSIFTEEEMELQTWTYETFPYDKKGIDGLNDDGINNIALFRMEDREMDFWNKINVDPSFIFEEFRCEKQFNKKDDYYEVYKKYKPQFTKLGMNLKIEKQFHEEDDVILTKHEDKYFVGLYKNETIVLKKELTL